MKRTLLFFCTLFLVVATSMGQAKKPTLMVVPSNVWMTKNGYMETIDNQGKQVQVPNYAKALNSNSELNNVISQIGNLMIDRGFPLKKLQAALEGVAEGQTEDLAFEADYGDSLEKGAMDQLDEQAKADIRLELDWTVNTIGPKRSITYNLTGVDVYSKKQVAGAQGTGAQSFSAETAILLEEAVQVHMEDFTARLQAHFDDMMQNGREVRLTVRVTRNAGVNLETEFDDMELSEYIEDWMAENTVNHRFSTLSSSANILAFEQVRIPLYKANGTTALDAKGFARQLISYLKKAPFNLSCKPVERGLGHCWVVIGEK